MKNKLRNTEHKKNQEVESILKEFQSLFASVPITENETLREPELPILFIMGCARSGTTLLYQALAASGIFAYPSNLMSRFYYAPGFAAKLHRLLIDLDSKGELYGRETRKNDPRFSSELGKTRGADSPHEFWYYWRQYFKFGELQKMSKSELANSHGDQFLAGLNQIQCVFNKPLVLKGMIMNWHIPYLAKLSPKLFFVHIERGIAFNAQSLLRAREKFFGSDEHWYSFKPPEYPRIEDKLPEEQVVDQVHYTNEAIRNGLNKVDEDRYKIISYKDLCQNPNKVISDIVAMLGLPTIDIADETMTFENNNRIRIDREKWHNIVRASKKWTH